jgi:hypothetical protein
MTRPRARTSDEELPRWKFLVAAGVLGGVAVIMLVVLLWRWLGPSVPEDRAAGETPVAASVGPSARADAVAPMASPAAPSPTGRAAAPGGERVRREREVLIARVRDALDAWEAFARSGDLDDVTDAFVVGGPQYRQFRREAGQGRAGPAVGHVPEMSVRSVVRVDRDGRRRSVVARMALIGADGVADRRRWMFVLEQLEGTWRVWTVIDRTRHR